MTGDVMAQKGVAIALGVIVIVGLIAAVVPFPCTRCGGRGTITILPYSK